jgi:hypothetical protein
MVQHVIVLALILHQPFGMSLFACQIRQ